MIDVHLSEPSTILFPNAWRPESSIFDNLDLPPIDPDFEFGNVLNQIGSTNSWNENPAREDEIASILEPSSNSFDTKQGDFLEPGYDLPTRYHQDQSENLVYEDQYPWAGNIVIPVPCVSNQAFATKENGPG